MDALLRPITPARTLEDLLTLDTLHDRPAAEEPRPGDIELGEVTPRDAWN